jgi:hypothetical protein
VGQVLHTQVGHPFASGTTPFVHMRVGLQLAGPHIGHEGGCHAHLPSVPRRHIAEMGGAPPMHSGCLKAGCVPHSVCVHAGAGLHAHVGQPLASSTLPY